MIDQLTRDAFEGLPPESLRVTHGAGEIALSVVEVRDLPDRSSRKAPFAVVLQGPRTPLLPQSIHRLHHPRHGSLELFLVPIAQDAAHARYELIFN